MQEVALCGDFLGVPKVEVDMQSLVSTLYMFRICRISDIIPPMVEPSEISKLNLKSIALNKDKLGSLTFEQSLPFMQKLQTLFDEMNDLNYLELLSKEETDDVTNHAKSFASMLQRVIDFDIGRDNPKVQHDNLETEIKNFYNSATRRLRGMLVFLRQEAERASRAGKDLAAEHKAATKARKEYETISSQLKTELDALKNRQQEVEAKHGEVAAQQLAIHFDKEAKEHGGKAGPWLRRRAIFFWSLFGILVFNFLLYFGLFILNRIGWTAFGVNDLFTYQYGIGKLALITLLWYGMNFASRNYAVESHLEATNQHRRNVAQTLEDFLATNPSPEVQSEMLKNGTTAMFEHLQVGYLRKEEVKDDSSPLQEIVNMWPRKE